MFLIISICFLALEYFIFTISLPYDDKISSLDDMFFNLAIFEIIIALLLICTIFSYIKRIMLLNREFGKHLMWMSWVLVGSNLVAGAFNYWFGKGGFETML